jgi:hypothetical protein
LCYATATEKAGLSALPDLTEAQQQALDALKEHGSIRSAAEALGINRASMQDRLRHAARKGHAPGHWENGTAPGYVMGKVTIQRGPSGVERVWERQSPDNDAMRAAIETAVRDLCDRIPSIPASPAPQHTDSDLLTIIPIGDPHFGMLSWEPETGVSFDLEKAERVTFGAVDMLAGLTPNSETVLLLNLGDYFHADDSSNRTPRGQNALDVDGRFQKVASVGFRAMIRCIERLLEKHAKVIVRNNPGNHDPHQALMLNIAVGARFHNEPRVFVDPSPSPFYYYRHGTTLIGSTHGDGPKLADLPLLMANDARDDWAASDYRVWHVGHFHHNQKLAQKDLVGCEVETHRTLAATDAWHHHSGYRSQRDMKAITYSKQDGEVIRQRVGIKRLT